MNSVLSFVLSRVFVHQDGLQDRSSTIHSPGVHMNPLQIWHHNLLAVIFDCQSYSCLGVGCPPFLTLAIYLLLNPFMVVQMTAFVVLGSLLTRHGVEFVDVVLFPLFQLCIVSYIGIHCAKVSFFPPAWCNRAHTSIRLLDPFPQHSASSCPHYISQESEDWHQRSFIKTSYNWNEKQLECCCSRDQQLQYLPIIHTWKPSEWFG